MMKKQLRFLCTLLLMVVASMAWAQDVTYSFSEFKSDNSVELKADNDNLSITLAKGSGATKPAWNANSSEARVYAAGSLTVASDVKKISKIVYTYTINANNKGTAPTINDVKGSTSDGTWDAENKTWEGSDKTVTLSTSGTAGNVGFKKLEVWYEEGGEIEKRTANVTIDNTTIKIGNTATVSTNGPDVTLATSDVNIASVTGTTVTGVAAGEATITATWAENDEFNAGSKAFTVTVVDPNGPGTENNPYTVAQARAAIDAGSGVTGVYAKGIVSEIVTAYSSQYGNITYNISEDGETTSDQLQAYRGKSYDGANFASADDIRVGDKVVIYGNLKKFNSTYEFDANNQLVSLVRDVEKKSAELAYSASSFTATIGKENEFPTLNNPNGLDVTYSSSNPDVATINKDGVVTLVAAGTTTIKATTEETDEIYAGEASYTLTVKEIIANAVTWDLTKDETASASEEELTWTSEQATMTAAKASNGTNANNYYPGTKDKNYTSTRFYKNNTLTLAPTEGYKLTSIVFTATTEAYAKALAESTWTNATVEYSDKTVTITPTDGTNAVVATIGATTGHSEVVVYYADAPVDERLDPGFYFTPEELTIISGQEYEAPEFVDEKGIEGVVFSSTDEEIAKWDAENGLVLGEKLGTATITATFEGDDNYKPGTATLIVTVKESVPDFAEVVVGTGKYKKITSADELEAGRRYIIAYETVDENVDPTVDAYAGVDNKIGKVASITLTDGLIDNASTTAPANPVVLQSAGNKNWFIMDGENFLAYTYKTGTTKNNNIFIEDNAATDGTAWTIDFEAEHLITNAYNTERALQYNYNNGDPRFACYTSKQKDVVLYKELLEESSKVGDVNKDGSVTIADVTALVNIILGKDDVEPYQYDHAAADVDGKNSITVADVEALVKLILDKE